MNQCILLNSELVGSVDSAGENALDFIIASQNFAECMLILLYHRMLFKSLFLVLVW